MKNNKKKRHLENMCTTQFHSSYLSIQKASVGWQVGWLVGWLVGDHLLKRDFAP
jgi:hypothetical protein